MVTMLEDKREALEALCRRFGVAGLEVFGSVLRDDFRAGESADPYVIAHAYFDLLDELRALFRVEVDLVMTGAVKNRYLAREIERTKQPLYAA